LTFIVKTRNVGNNFNFSALIDGKTSVCVEGRNNYGQLGLPDKGKSSGQLDLANFLASGLDIVNIPTVVASLNDIKIRQVACGGGHTIALTGKYF
jgi:alpha-tubulin suppressor-like RCC1 family protein